MKLVLFQGIALWVILSVFSNPLSAQQLQWFANDHFQIEEKSIDEWSVFYEKNSWEAFTLYVSDLDFSQKSSIQLALQSDQDITLRIDLMDTDGQQLGNASSTITLEGGETFSEIEYDFSTKGQNVNLGNISHLHFYVNPGVKAQGVLVIKNIILPKPLSPSTEIRVYPNPAQEILKINTTEKLFDEVLLFDGQGRVVAIKKIAATHQLEWQLTTLIPGNYTYQINYQQQPIHSGKLVIK